MTPPMSVERALEVARRLESEFTAKLLEPIHHGPCDHAPDCPGHYGEVHWLGLETARDEIRDIAKVLEALGPFVAAAGVYFSRVNFLVNRRPKYVLRQEWDAMYEAWRALSPEEGPRT